MLKHYLLIMSSALLLCFTCTAQLSSKKTIINNSEMLYGEISKDQLYFDYPVWKEVETEYSPSNEVVAAIAKHTKIISVTIFLGTWCPDSRRNVPQFFKSLSQNSNMKYDIWAVNGKKQLDNDLIGKLNIKRVPTFIFFDKGVEIGRITEYPKETMEEDILAILNKH